MSDLSALPNPGCGATAPDGEACPSDSTVVVASEWPTGYPMYSMAVWRCNDHVGESVETALRISPDAVITVTPLAIADQAAEQPAPEPPAPTQRSLHLVR
jgi:hypothetical protein